MNDDFWGFLDRLAAEHTLVIDRPKGTRHPRCPEIIYPLDYGYLEGTTAGDGGGIDVWVGSRQSRDLTALLVTVDLFKRDAEIKLLLGCTEAETQIALACSSDGDLRALLVRRP